MISGHSGTGSSAVTLLGETACGQGEKLRPKGKAPILTARTEASCWLPDEDSNLEPSG
jgi:hypothetical protein